MKKPLIALLMASAVGSSAFAETPLTVYGVMDVGVAHERDDVSGRGNTTRLDSGIQAGSRLGFRGTEDLGGGLSAVFTAEMGFAIDTGTMTQGALFGRQIYLGLQSHWGSLTLGRHYTPYYLVLSGVADPFGGGLAGTAENLMWRSGTRMSNAVVYVLPEWRGFNAELAYSFSETRGNSDRGRGYSGALGYSAGPFVIKLAHHSLNDQITDIREKGTLLAGTYDLNGVKLHVGLADNDNVLTGSSGAIRNADSRDWVAGASLPFGQNTFLVSYVRKDDRTALNQDARQWAVGYTYRFSKRTNLYTSFARINNDNGAAYTVGNSMNVGTGEQQFNLGLHHKF